MKFQILRETLEAIQIVNSVVALVDQDPSTIEKARKIYKTITGLSEKEFQEFLLQLPAREDPQFRNLFAVGLLNAGFYDHDYQIQPRITYLKILIETTLDHSLTQGLCLDIDQIVNILIDNKSFELLNLLILRGSEIVSIFSHVCERTRKAYDLFKINDSKEIDSDYIEVFQCMVKNIDFFDLLERDTASLLKIFKIIDRLQLYKIQSLHDIIQKKINIKDGCGATILHRSVLKENIELIRRMVLNGADINAEDNQKQIPLYWAVTNFKEPMVIALIALRTEISVDSISNASFPLHLAVLYGDHILADTMLKEDISLKYMIDSNGQMPSHYAAFIGRKNFIDLIFTSTNINCKDRLGNTALHLAIQKGHYKMGRELLKKGAQAGIVNINGSTVRDIAKMQLHKIKGMKSSDSAEIAPVKRSSEISQKVTKHCTSEKLLPISPDIRRDAQEAQQHLSTLGTPLEAPKKRSLKFTSYHYPLSVKKR